ncbi:3-phosphoserine/phosphohydroxythreonine transaminase [Collinsella vaginalis]|uniref:3-phosphoserine/phosphohydroxythreonine transaminase n=1 Tax=Collinsella vaginalis TaxID=1870987 RepID=UPI000A267E30|nr:3-phosphoserine/phosphohydroxythreonine transaminase [Collinsella vaginalis]
MARVHNFSAGPAALPLEVLEEAQAEFLDYAGTGMSVLEMSHRSAVYQAIIDDAEATLRRILRVPDTYRILFFQGGATLQFAGVPLNLMRTGRAGYVVSGNFAKKAWQEAQRYGDAHLLATSAETNFDRIPDLSSIAAAARDLDYVHICQNNTIFGTTVWDLPETGDTPLVADVSSCFLSFPLDIERYGLVYAGAQKNAGPAGVTVVIVRDDLIGEAPARADICPTYLSYRAQANAGSMYNTPNSFGIYLSGKVFHWVERTGGLAEMERRNREKAELLYGFLDGSKLFHGTADRASRSISNVTFRTDSPELDAAVIAGAAEHGIVGIKGHRLVGGMRASVYNAVSLESVRVLVDYLGRFEREHQESM